MNEFLKLICNKDFNALFKKPTNNTAIQFFRYSFVGGAATIVDWGSLWLLHGVLGILDYLSVGIAFCLGLTLNFIFANSFVFKGQSSKKHSAQFLVYFITGLIGLALTELFMLFFDKLFHMHYMLAKIITTAIVFIWNFGSKKVILYRKREK